MSVRINGDDGGKRPKANVLASAFASIRSGAPWIFPAALAMGLCQSLMYIPFILGPLGVGLGNSIWWDPRITATFFLVACAAMVVDGYAARHGHTKIVGACGMQRAQAAVLSVGQCLLVVQHLVADGSARLVIGCLGAALSGFGVACCQLSSARFLARLKPYGTFEIILVAQSVTALVLLYAILSPSAWFGLPMVLFAPAALALIGKADGNLPFEALLQDGPQHELLGNLNPSDSWNAGVVCGCTVAVGTLSVFVCGQWFNDLIGAGQPSSGILFQVGTLVATALLVSLATSLLCLKTKTLTMTLVYRIAIPLLAVSALLGAVLADAPVANVPADTVAMVLGAAGLVLFDQMSWFISAGFMRANEKVSEVTATRVRSMQYIGATVGALLVPSALASWGVERTLFAAIAVLLVVFVVCVPTFEPHLVSPGAAQPQGLRGLGDNLHDRLSLAVAQFGFTAREAEVLSLLMEGADAARISEELVISKPTANTHIRHIYAKCEVHSRQELVDKVGLSVNPKM